MKRSLINLTLVVSSFLLGWFAHRFNSVDLDKGRQWQFGEAAQRGDIREVERLFPGRAHIDDEPSYADGFVFGLPALLQAAGAGEPEAVAWLLAHGADPNRQTSDSWPLAAAEHRLLETTKTIEILKANGAKNLHPR